jgi:hypothetical protein
MLETVLRSREKSSRTADTILAVEDEGAGTDPVQ